MVLFLLFAILFQAMPTVSSFLRHLESRPLTARHEVVEKFFAKHPATPVIEQDSIVWFFYHGPAQVVAVTGDLQHAWSLPDTMTKIGCGDEGLFYRRYIVPPDARVDYKLVVDGREILDPMNPRTAPSGFGDHSELRMPRFTSDRSLRERTGVQKGSLDTLQFVSRNPGIRPRPVLIYTPAGYSDTLWYPTVYVHDGRDAIDFALMPRVLDNLVADGAIRPLIAVFIPPVERSDEYIHARHIAFGDALCDELVPMIDRTYRTSMRPEDRLMMGISNGGHISLRTVLRRPDTFLNAAGQSSTPTHDLFFGIDRALQAEASRPAFRLYLDVGVYDLGMGEAWSFLEGNRAIHRALLTHEQPHVYHEFNDGHQWANWRERTAEILEWFVQRTTR